jgi:uncharacterized protein YggL (DUF469 family)
MGKMGEPLETTKLVAHITLNGVGDMDDAQREAVADWLKEQAKAVVKEGHEYANKVRLRLHWPSNV